MYERIEMNTLYIISKWKMPLIVAGLAVLSSSPIRACSVPVFQYALAYWPVDLYEVMVFHRGPLSSEDQAALDKLKQASRKPEFHANLTVRTVDLAESPGVWESQLDLQPPCVVLKYPRISQIPGTVWSAPLTAANVERLLDSPIRKEIAGRILKGETAVWVFLESGVQEQDEAAAALLESELEKISEQLRIIVPEETAAQLDETDLRVSFSMVRLSRDDPDEAALTQMLLNSEWDLKMLNKPLAFPIFGRGRALYALAGDGIEKSNIAEACSFLAGWCSCEIKEQNPGVDILMSVNWDNLISQQLYDRTTQLLNASEATTTEKGNLGAVKRNVLAVILIQFLVVAILAFVILWRRRQRA